MGEYVNCKTYIFFHCKKHNIDFINHPIRVLNGVGCPQCSNENLKKSKTKTHKWYLNELKTKNPNVIPLENYVDMKTHIMHKCLLHNVEWKSIPSNILKGCGCPKCLSEKIAIKNKKSNEDYLNELKEKNINIYPLETYIDALTNILHRCPVCGYEWSVRPANILFGKSCPQCNQSKGELQIKNWLEKYNISYEPQKIFQECKDIDYLRFDFYLPIQNKCIEYDGKQHFEPINYFGGQKGLKYLQRHDRMKNKYCKDNNIPLLRIPYYANIDEELFNFLLN